VNSDTITLGIEAAIAGGSLSLVAGQNEVASWCGDAEGLRAEGLILEIENLLRSGGVVRQDVGRIAVSAGPGSFTGIRIGLATGMGLKSALETRSVNLSALEAMAFSHRHTGVAAVPMGRGAACAQRFVDGCPKDAPFSISATDLFDVDLKETLLVHEALATGHHGKAVVINFGKNIAFALAQLALAHPIATQPPLFISKQY
jgi:tRNA threonylcarbamoyl adenosine modification protein YeaZ